MFSYYSLNGRIVYFCSYFTSFYFVKHITNLTSSVFTPDFTINVINSQNSFRLWRLFCRRLWFNWDYGCSLPSTITTFAANKCWRLFELTHCGISYLGGIQPTASNYENLLTTKGWKRISTIFLRERQSNSATEISESPKSWKPNLHPLQFLLTFIISSFTRLPLFTHPSAVIYAGRWHCC